MTRKNYRKLVGIGLYTVPEAARYVGAPYSKVKRWIGDTTGYAPVIERDAPLKSFVTFHELLDLMFVSLFRKEGVSLQTIRRAAAAASRKFHAKHPFAVRRFDTDGRSIFATLCDEEGGKTLIEDLARGQLVFEQIIKPFFRRVEYQGAEAVRYWPLDPSGRIVLDPDRRLGQPIDAETGVPMDAILAALSAGGGQEAAEVALWFDIPVEAVQAAISFDRSLVL